MSNPQPENHSAPGIYVAARHLNQSGIGSLGSHQFVYAISPSMCFAGSFTLNDISTIVVGAYNQNGNLEPLVNNRNHSDAQALGRYFSGGKNLDIARTRYENIDMGISKILAATRKFIRTASRSPISYPANGGFSITGGYDVCDDGIYNSNSWAQSLITHALGPNLVRRDFSGVDACRNNLIPASYFS